MKTRTLFTASWCNPCKELKRWMTEGNITVDEIIDIDENPKLAQKYKIIKVPSMVISLDGLHLNTLTGREEIKPELEN